MFLCVLGLEFMMESTSSVLSSIIIVICFIIDSMASSFDSIYVMDLNVDFFSFMGGWKSFVLSGMPLLGLYLLGFCTSPMYEVNVVFVQ